MFQETVLYGSSDGVAGTDSTGRFLPITHVQQKLAVVPFYWNPSTLAYEAAQQASGGAGGGGAATIADGADVAQGAKSDAAWDGAAVSASRLAIAKHAGGKLEAIRALLAGVLTIALPTGASTAAKQDTGNTSLGSIDTKTPALVGGRVPVDPSGVTQPISAAALPLPAGAATSALQTTGNTSVGNLDTTTGAKTDAAWDLAAAAPSSVSIRKKIAGLLDSIRISLAGTLLTSSAQLPAALTGAGNLKVSITEDGGAVISVDDNAASLTVDASDVTFGATVTPKAASVWDISDRVGRLLGVIASITNALPAGTNKIGTVDIATAPATAKGTQGANGVPTQDLKDAGRTRWSCATVIAGVAGVAAEALLSMVVQRNSTPGAAATTQAVTAGKRLRLTTLTIGIISTAAAVVSVRVTLRCNPTGALVVASPIELIVPIPSGAAAIQAGGSVTIPLPEGLEYAGTEQFGLTHVGSVATYTLWASLNGYEY